MRCDVLRDARDQRRLAASVRLVARAEPVPAFRTVGFCRLRRIRHQEPVRFGELVHPRARGEVVRRLRTAMQHHQQRRRRARAGDVICGHVQHVASGASCVAEGSGEPLPARCGPGVGYETRTMRLRRCDGIAGSRRRLDQPGLNQCAIDGGAYIQAGSRVLRQSGRRQGAIDGGGDVLARVDPGRPRVDATVWRAGAPEQLCKEVQIPIPE